MRTFALNLLTCSVTAALLVALALPAKRALDVARESRPVELPWPRPAGEPRRAFGVYVDPWHVDDWARGVGAAPQLVAKFEAFSRGRTIDRFLAQTSRIGIRRTLVSWEPWAPVPAAYGTARQSARSRGTATWTSRAGRRTATSCASRAASRASTASCTCASGTR